MKKFSPSTFFRGRFPLAILAGLVLATAFPKIGIAGFAWIAPALILATALGKSGGETFRIGYVAGLAHYLGSLYWLLNIPVTGYPILGWIALSAFLALFPALWLWLTLHTFGRSDEPKPDCRPPGPPRWSTSTRSPATWPPRPPERPRRRGRHDAPFA